MFWWASPYGHRVSEVIEWRFTECFQILQRSRDSIGEELSELEPQIFELSDNRAEGTKPSFNLPWLLSKITTFDRGQLNETCCNLLNFFFFCGRFVDYRKFPKIYVLNLPQIHTEASILNRNSCEPGVNLIKRLQNVIYNCSYCFHTLKQ